MTRPTPSLIRFGRFQFDSNTRRLVRDGVLLEIPASVADVLEKLLTRPGTIVPHDALQSPASIELSVDQPSPHNAGPAAETVRTAVRQLRQTLRDPADYPMYIETIRGVGYRFIAPVTLADNAVSATDEPSENRSSVPLPNLVQWSRDDDAALDFSVLWLAATMPVALLTGPGWLPLLLLAPPVVRIGQRWTVVSRLRADGIHASDIRTVLDWADVSAATVDTLRGWRLALQHIATASRYLGCAMIAAVTACNVFEPWNWSAAAQEAFAMVYYATAFAACAALLLTMVESIVSPLPVFRRFRHTVQRFWRSRIRNHVGDNSTSMSTDNSWRAMAESL